MRALPAVVAALVLLGGTAALVAPIGEQARAVNDAAPAAGPHAAALARAVALISFDPGTLGHRLRVGAARPGVRAQLDRETRTISLFARKSDPPHRWAHDLAHELGHAFDDLHMSDADRRDYLRRRGSPGADWAARPGRSDYAVGAGDFAEVFALCHAASPDFRSRLAPRPADPCTLLPAAALRLPDGPPPQAPAG